MGDTTPVPSPEQRRRNALYLLLGLVGLVLLIIIVVVIVQTRSAHPAGPTFTLASMSTGAGGSATRTVEAYQITLANHASTTLLIQRLVPRYTQAARVRALSGHMTVWEISRTGQYTRLLRTLTPAATLAVHLPPGSNLQLQGDLIFATSPGKKRTIPRVTGVTVHYQQGGKTQVMTLPPAK